MTDGSQKKSLTNRSGYEPFEEMQDLIGYLERKNVEYSDIFLRVGSPPSIQTPVGIERLSEFARITSEKFNSMTNGIAPLSHKTQKKMAIFDSLQYQDNCQWVWARDRNRNQDGFRCTLIHLYEDRYSLVMHKVPHKIPSLEALNLPYLALQRLLEEPEGLIVITGKGGSGKSTTVAAMLEWLNAHSSTIKRVLTVEQPIEYFFQDGQCLFEQQEIEPFVPHLDWPKVSYASALGNALETTFSVVMIDKVPDAESAEKAFELAQIDSLVIITIPGIDGPTALLRLVNLLQRRNSSITTQQVARSLKAV